MGLSDGEYCFQKTGVNPRRVLFTALLHKIAIAAIIASAMYLVVNIRRTLWGTVEYAVLVATTLVTPPLRQAIYASYDQSLKATA